MNGTFQAVLFPIKANRELGYLTGFILGDGCVVKRDYKIRVGSSKKELISMFELAVREVFPELKVYQKERTHKYKQGRVPYFEAEINTKQLWSFLRPLKLTNFEWRYPFEMNTIEFRKGFLQGIFDTEGWIYNAKGKWTRIGIGQKQRINIDQIVQLLKSFDITGTICRKKTTWEFNIDRYPMVTKFIREIGFRFPRKVERQGQVLETKHSWLSEAEKIQIKNLKKGGVPYSKIREITDRSLATISMIERDFKPNKDGGEMLL